jgi:hypothetical protein
MPAHFFSAGSAGRNGRYSHLRRYHPAGQWLMLRC